MRALRSKQHRPVFTPEERAQWVSRFRSSGLTQVQFAQQHGLKPTTLQRWLYGRGPKQKRPKATFREIVVSPLGPTGAWAAEITWPHGVTVRLGAEAEASWIEALLHAVCQAC